MSSGARWLWLLSGLHSACSRTRRDTSTDKLAIRDFAARSPHARACVLRDDTDRPARRIFARHPRSARRSYFHSPRRGLGASRFEIVQFELEQLQLRLVVLGRIEAN